MNKMPETIGPEGFSELARDPESWFVKARALERCADSLWSSFVQAFNTPGRAKEIPDYLETACLLYGLCLEVAFKGTMIQACPENVKFATGKDDSIVSFSGIGRGGHDLVALASAAGFSDSITPVLRLDLETLTRCVMWLSRYPTPRKVASTGEDPRINLGLRNRVKSLIAAVLCLGK